jgi:arsenate reductase
MITAYVYRNCDTCRAALKWLDEHGIRHEVKAIREAPPSHAELEAALRMAGGDIRKLFNTSGMDYRALGMKDRLPAMSESEAIALLSENGNLVKRPFLVGKGIVLTGFQPEVWEKTLAAS